MGQVLFHPRYFNHIATDYVGLRNQGGHLSDAVMCCSGWLVGKLWKIDSVIVNRRQNGEVLRIRIGNFELDMAVIPSSDSSVLYQNPDLP